MKKSLLILATLLITMTLFFTGCNSESEKALEPTETDCVHDYETEITTHPTCAEAGVKTFICSICDDSYTEKIAATGEHTYVSEVTTKPTCIKSGVKTFSCSVCDNSYTEEIAATGEHTYTSEITTEPTFSEDGVKTFVCSGCDHSYTEAMDATGKWSAQELSDICNYALDACDDMDLACDYANAGYTSTAVSYFGEAIKELVKIRDLAYNRLPLPSASDDFETLQAQIEDAVNYANKIVNTDYTYAFMLHADFAIFYAKMFGIATTGTALLETLTS